MILVTQIVVTRRFPLILDGRLYDMQIGDTLNVATELRDLGADIPATLAKALILNGYCQIPSDTGEEFGVGEQEIE